MAKTKTLHVQRAERHDQLVSVEVDDDLSPTEQAMQAQQMVLNGGGVEIGDVEFVEIMGFPENWTVTDEDGNIL